MAKKEEAIAELSLLIENDPEAWYFRSDRGAILLQNGHIEEAMADLCKAVDLAPYEAVARLKFASTEVVYGLTSHISTGCSYTASVDANLCPGFCGVGS
jgi:predicted Zn-dependent protease